MAEDKIEIVSYPWDGIFTKPYTPNVSDCTIENLLRTVEELRAKLPQPEFDCLVATEGIWRRMQKEFPELTHRLDHVRLLGMDLYVVGDKAGAIALGWKLREAGKRPALIEEGP